MNRLGDIDLVALAAGDDVGPPLQTALHALALAWPEVPPARWPALDVARRDALLLALRRDHFGDRLDAESTCPACGERLEYTLSATALAGDAAAPPVPLPAEPPAPLILCVGDEQHALRRPGTDDLLAAADVATLLRRCAEVDGGGADPAWCADPVWQQAFGDALAAESTLVDPALALSCPACGHAWEETFDIARFLAEDLAAAGRRLLDEVHVMALAYHWTERDILALPAARRRHYLGRLQA